MNQIPIILLSPSELPAQTQGILSLWARAVPHPFQLKADLWQQILELPISQENALQCLAAFSGSKLLGLALVRLGAPTILDAILVDPEARRQGLGTALLQQALGLRREPGPLRFGGGPYHLVPGLPVSWQTAESVFTRWGFRADWMAHDLLWEESTSPIPSWVSPKTEQVRLLQPQEFPALKSLMSLFGQRWQRDTAWRSDSGRLRPNEEVMGAFKAGQILGFCHLWSPRSTRFGPSTFWLDRSDGAWGGIGPVGVHPDHRGTGAGSRLVRAALQHLQQGGARRIGVDWTAVPEFYQKCGFRTWQCYRGWIRQEGGLESEGNRKG